MDTELIGIRGPVPFEDLVAHFTSLGGDVVLMDPDMVCGREHVMSAVMHAERAFSNGTNRSKTILTEILLYCAWERQIGKALSKMKPKEGRDEYVALLIDVDDPHLDEIGMVRDDSLYEPTEWKCEKLGLRSCFLPPVDQALENVAMVDLMKM
ncbi:MAG: hypothetical protein J6K69_07570 [Candidatus Methanomethylophilaceae archaeon]|nr:hypothetical protein [Candidatus Methanomethylophilaceae archaeon]